MLRLRIAALGAIAAIAMLFATNVQAQDITIGVAKFSGHAPFFVGIEKGIYAKHGLNAKAKIYTAAVPMLQAQANGEQDISGPGATPFLLSVANGIDLVAIGAIQNFVNSTNFTVTSIISGPNSGIGEGEIAKLKGKKIATFFGSVAEQQVRQVAASAGLTDDDYELVNMPPPQMITALKTGAVDAIAVWEPFPSIAIVKVPGSSIVLHGAGPCTTCYDVPLFVTSSKIISEKRALIEKFWLAHAEAMQYTRTHIDEAAEVTQRWVEGVDLEAIQISLRKDAASMDPRLSGAFIEGFKKNSIPFLVNLGRIETFDPTPFVNLDFQKAAMKTNPELFTDLPPIDSKYQ